MSFIYEVYNDSIRALEEKLDLDVKEKIREAARRGNMQTSFKDGSLIDSQRLILEAIGFEIETWHTDSRVDVKWNDPKSPNVKDNNDNIAADDIESRFENAVAALAAEIESNRKR